MSERHLSWPNLQSLVQSGAPARFRIPGEPRLEIMMESGGSALSLLVPQSEVNSVPATSLEAIRTETISIDAEQYVRVVTHVRPLYEEFYLLLTQIADSIQLDKDQLDVAVRKRLESWKELLRSIGVLTADQQLGLLGEIWVLQRLISAHGVSAIESWTGPLGEPHDFRYGEIELEVKSTRNRQRSHIINGLQQLQASKGLRLYLLSLQFEPANTSDAISLAQAVSTVRSFLSIEVPRLISFNRVLAEGCGYRVEDEQHYKLKYRLRSQPMLIEVSEKVPKLTREIVREAVGNEAEQRITDVRYTLNVDDLGVMDGTADFIDVLPAGKPLSMTP